MKSLRLLSVALLACTLPLATACSQSAESQAVDDTADSLINGRVAPASALGSGVLLWVNQAGSQCTAVRVGPRHLLTAAHCVVANLPSTKMGTQLLPGFVAGSPIWYTRAPAVALNDTSSFSAAFVQSTILAPGFALSCALAGCSVSDLYTLSIADMALVTLDRDVEGNVATAFVDTQPLRDGDQVTLSGYGCIDGSWALPPIREFRFGVSKTLSPSAASSGAQPIFPINPLLFGNTYALTPGASFGGSSSSGTPAICPGDSGGPLYRGTPQPGMPDRVVGINSGILFDSAQIATVNYHTRIENGIGGFSPMVMWLKTLLPASSFL